MPMERAILALVTLALCTLAPAEDSTPPAGAQDDEGFVSLFNGNDLTGWKGDPKHWSVRDGAITGESTRDNPLRHNTFLVWQGGDVGDFELRVTCRIRGNNSGIQYRSRLVDPQKFVVHGYQADFGPGESHNGKLYDEGGRAALAQPGQKVVVGPDGKIEVVGTLGDPAQIKRGIPEDTWVQYTIIARGNRLVHQIDGQTMIEATDEQEDERDLTGLLALQMHGGEPMTVQFKDIRLKALAVNDEARNQNDE
jgi:hypothetical protein